jgi:hypothetical protein
MSNLLEEAIIDVSALKEVAIKNAEASLIEKYSKEFKESVEKLLEQEAASAPTAGLATDSGLGAAPTAPKEEPIKNVPSSFLQSENDDELITIDFDQIKKEVEKALGKEIPASSDEEMPEESSELPEAPSEQTEQPEMQAAEPEQASGQLAEELELEFDEELLSEAYDGGLQQDVAEDALTPGGGVDEADEQQQLEEELMSFLQEESENGKESSSEVQEELEESEELDEEFELTEEIADQLEEELKVDLKPEHQLRGYMGTTTLEKKLADNVEKAAARDQKAIQEREEEQKAMSDLKKKLTESKNKNEKLSETIEEFKTVLLQLKEHTEKLSVSNAKLLYTNKVLENNSLNERQKNQIVETISRSNSVLEAKTIYETLQSAVDGISEKKKVKESLSEALNRNQTPFLVRQKQVSQEDPFADRMMRLAGIKNKT